MYKRQNQGRVVKGVNFVNLRDAGDPVEIAAAYDKAGADELVFLDITATSDARETVADMVRKLSLIHIWIPITSSTWNAMFNLLKFVIMNKPFFSDGSIPRHFFRSITVIIVSRGIKIPSTQGCAFGTGVTC